MTKDNIKLVAIIVTNPDEVVMSVGGTILSNPFWRCFVVCLTKANDPELSPRFFNALRLLKSDGVMGNLDEKIESKTATESDFEREIIHLLPDTKYDLIITHNHNDKNIIHILVHNSIIKLLDNGLINVDELWTFETLVGGLYLQNNTSEIEIVNQVFSESVSILKNNILKRVFTIKGEILGRYTNYQAENFEVLNKKNNNLDDGKKYGYDLNIFRAPTIEALKYLYHKSRSIVSDIDNWMLKDAPEIVDQNPIELEKLNSSYKYFGKDLKIFQKTTIEKLKENYYANLSFLFDKSFWKSTLEREDSYRLDIFNLSKKKKSINKDIELNLFKTFTIDNLKTLYANSLNRKFVPEIDGISSCEDLNYFNANISNQHEPKIFKYLSVDRLKSIASRKDK